MTDIDENELRKLVSRWRRWSEFGHGTDADIGYNQGLETAAEELERLIESEVDTSDYTTSPK